MTDRFDETLPFPAALLLLRPERVRARLRAIEAAGLVPITPTPFQIAIGIARMWERVLFRSETIGQSRSHSPRDTWRAKLFESRPLRFPFLLAEKAVAPLDFSGLLSSRERILRHLLGAHHDRVQFLYDFELLESEPGALEELRERARAVVERDDPRSEFLRDLVVFEGYHEALLSAVDAKLAGEPLGDAEENADPDISLRAYLMWCADQPKDMRALLEAVREGRISFGPTRVEMPAGAMA